MRGLGHLSAMGGLLSSWLFLSIALGDRGGGHPGSKPL